MKNYIEQALRTESIDHFKVDRPRLLHAAMGVATETAEIFLAEDGSINLKEEMGDVLWYVAIGAADLELTFEELREGANVAWIDDDVLKALFGASGELMDVLKRGCFYGVQPDLERFARELGTVLVALEVLIEDCGWTLGEVQKANIAKLSARFPEKFTTEAAVSRDLDAEEAALK